jgi:ribosomal protein L15
MADAKDLNELREEMKKLIEEAETKSGNITDSIKKMLEENLKIIRDSNEAFDLQVNTLEASREVMEEILKTGGSQEILNDNQINALEKIIIFQ